MSGALAKAGKLVFGGAPAGYRPGVLLTKLRDDLRSLDCEPVSQTCCRFRLAEPELEIVAEERVEAQFLMHIVTARFSMRLHGSADRTNRLTLRHRGSWKRAGLDCTITEGDDVALRELARKLEGDTDLVTALQPLDFTEVSCSRTSLAGRSASSISAQAKSSIAFRRCSQYVRLPAAQIPLLIRSFARLRTPHHGFASYTTSPLTTVIFTRVW